jgi:hypothetical protein
MKPPKRTVKLKWSSYSNFFTLYNKKGTVKRLIYVIGNKRLVYVGCVGARGGKGGLFRRYDKPYVERAKSIFGSATPSRQPAYSAEFDLPKNPKGTTILNVERIIQNAWKQKHPKAKPAFTMKGTIKTVRVVNSGKRPPFLAKYINA